MEMASKKKRSIVLLLESRRINGTQFCRNVQNEGFSSLIIFSITTLMNKKTRDNSIEKKRDISLL
jgi:hypothetical protein